MKNNAFQILQESPGPEHSIISGRKLPSNKQILLCLLANIEKLRGEDSSKNKRIIPAAIKLVEEQAVLHYQRSAIPVCKSRQITKRILHLYQKFQLIRKMKGGKIYDQCKNSIIEFRDQLTKTMPLYPNNAVQIMEKMKKGKTEIEKISIDQDIEFLKQMMTTRTGSYQSLDKITTSFMQNRQKRLEKQQIKAVTLQEAHVNVEESVLDAELAPGDSDLHLDVLTPRRVHRRWEKTGQTLLIPHDLLSRERIVSNYTRNKISTTSAASFLRDIIIECGGDPSKFVLNYASAYKYVCIMLT